MVEQTERSGAQIRVTVINPPAEEADIPYCYVPGVTNPRQVSVYLCRDRERIPDPPFGQGPSYGCKNDVRSHVHGCPRHLNQQGAPFCNAIAVHTE